MKRRTQELVKRAVRLVLHALCYPFPPAGPRVLVYHSVDSLDSPISVRPELFARHMDLLLRKGFTTWTAGRLVEALRAREALPRRLAVITFDDGYRNNVEQALPILEQRGMCATVFMVTGNAGDVPRWGERDRDRIRRLVFEVYPGTDADKELALEQSLATLGERIATWDELRGAPARGLEVQSHTRTHPFADDLVPESLHEELAGARRDLDRHGLGDGAALAWPYGACNDDTIAAAEAAGYRGTFLGESPWTLRKHPDPWRIPRHGVDSSQGVFGLAFQLGRGQDLWDWLKHLRGRLRGRRGGQEPRKRPAAQSSCATS